MMGRKLKTTSIQDCSQVIRHFVFTRYRKLRVLISKAFHVQEIELDCSGKKNFSQSRMEFEYQYKTL